MRMVAGFAVKNTRLVQHIEAYFATGVDYKMVIENNPHVGDASFFIIKKS